MLINVVPAGTVVGEAHADTRISRRMGTDAAGAICMIMMLWLTCHPMEADRIAGWFWRRIRSLADPVA
ncbi:hypothetical protein BST25_17605 [Mycobacterium heidelbergense]|uniref:Uncharacterized protein n=1 Tax=Mycobacterium heidelbergense TaxID=53376 RepID=A0A1X0DFF1_MYCHE|nr:hypothetical protein BST25_17605 [Mycobacterium heidelbergense]